MMKKSIVVLWIVLSSTHLIAQRQYKGYFNTKAGCHVTFNGGLSFSFGSAYWIVREDFLLKGLDLQPGINASFNLNLNHYSLGNKNRAGSRAQLNSILSPMTVLGIGRTLFFDEINPFYFGNSNAMISNHQSRFAFGSSFVLTPKSNNSLFSGKFSSDNVYSKRNKSQQLIFLNLKVGYLNADSSGWAVEFSHCNDNMIIPFIFQNKADHYDRYYTGGTKYSISKYGGAFKNKPFKVSFINEVYTGSFQRDLFDFPDIYDPEVSKFDSNKQAKSRYARYVAQDPGERMLNTGRKFFIIDLPLNPQIAGIEPSNFNASYLRLIVGKQGGENGMRSQNKNHSKKPIDKVNALRYDPSLLYSNRGKEKLSLERKHHFYPATEKSRWVIGSGFSL